MSVHKSLRIGSGDTRKRSVLTRAERVAILSKDGRFRAGQSVLGLPKTRVEKLKAKGKTKKKDEAATPAAGAAPAAGAPAAGAKGAAAAPAGKAAPAKK